MIKLARFRLKHIGTGSLLPLWIIIFSPTMFTIPAQAQAQEQANTVVSRHGPSISLDTLPTYVGEHRVTALDNFEAILSIVANLSEFVGVVCGLVLICRAIFFGKSNFIIPLLKIKLNRPSQIYLGLSLIIFVPAVINWLIASVNDSTMSCWYH